MPEPSESPRLIDGILWWGRIAFVPCIHGRATFAREVRRTFLEHRFRSVAVELPPSLRSAVIDGVERLPEITVVTYEEDDGTRCFVPVDPCDAIIEGVRLALAEPSRLLFIDREVENFDRRELVLPDSYAVHSIGTADYWATVAPYLPPSLDGSQDELRERHMAHRLAEELKQQATGDILCIVGLAHLTGIIQELARSRIEPPPPADDMPAPHDVRLRPVATECLYHVLGELPYVTYLWEKRRREITLEEFDQTEMLTRLLFDARDRFHRRHREEYERIPVRAVQNLLQLVRNHAVLGRRLTPGLYEMALAAKGIAGSEFALDVLRTAKRYPFHDDDTDTEALEEQQAGDDPAPGDSPEFDPLPGAGGTA